MDMAKRVALISSNGIILLLVVCLSISLFLFFSRFLSLCPSLFLSLPVPLYLSFLHFTCSLILRSYRLNIVYVHIIMYALLVDSFTKQQQNIQIKHTKCNINLRAAHMDKAQTTAPQSNSEQKRRNKCVFMYKLCICARTHENQVVKSQNRTI